AVRHRAHGKPHIVLAAWLGYYLLKTPQLEPSDNATIRLDEENEPQPDLLLRLPAGGKSKVSKDDYIEGPVEFVAEIAASTVSLDMHAKLDMYRSHGVQEYLIWRARDKKVDWFAYRGGRYVPLKQDSAGIFRSEVFPGLWLNVPALLRNDFQALYKTV